ncbi:hypothetical protein DL768_010487 [Monosporascus sp. mg162]|nr:hypothetical protein DL768_010487 [Monosporascus sp. mg162]
MAQAFHDLRKQKILHNDIKPANILYSRERGAVLIDFGLASYDGEIARAGGTPWERIKVSELKEATKLLKEAKAVKLGE